METAIQHLTKHGIRPSVQRVANMQYLMEHRTHPTVDMIYNDLLKTVPTLSRTTVYNTLELLAHSHAIRTLNIDKRNVRYDGIVEPHAHFMCSRCGKIADVDLDSHLKAHLLAEHDFRVEQVELNYTGVCSDCLAHDAETTQN